MIFLYKTRELTLSKEHNRKCFIHFNKHLTHLQNWKEIVDIEHAEEVEEDDAVVGGGC
jgi:hypothetical protein